MLLYCMITTVILQDHLEAACNLVQTMRLICSPMSFWRVTTNICSSFMQNFGVKELLASPSSSLPAMIMATAKSPTCRHILTSIVLKITNPKVQKSSQSFLLNNLPSLPCEAQTQRAVWLTRISSMKLMQKSWSPPFFWQNHDTIHCTSLGIIHLFLSVWELTTKTFFITTSSGKRKVRKQTGDVRRR